MIKLFLYIQEHGAVLELQDDLAALFREFNEALLIHRDDLGRVQAHGGIAFRICAHALAAGKTHVFHHEPRLAAGIKDFDIALIVREAHGLGGVFLGQ